MIMYLILLLLGLASLVGYKYYMHILPHKAPKTKSKKIVYEVVIPSLALFVSIALISAFMVRTVMVQDDKVLQDSIEALQTGMTARQEKQMAKAFDELHKNEDNYKHAVILGNPEGEIVVYEFMDFYCGHCRNVSKVVAEALKNRNDVKLVLKPLTFMHPLSKLTASAVVAAQMQGNGKGEALYYVMMNDKIQDVDLSKVKSIKDAEDLVKAKLFEMAAKAKLDVEKFKKDLESKEVEDELKRTADLAQSLQINSTPNFIIGKKLHPGAFQSADAFNAAVDESK